MSTRLYAIRSKDVPGWMTIGPVHPLTEKQWKVATYVLNEVGTRPSSRYVTTSGAAIVAGVSESCAREALDKLHKMGLVSRQPASGSRPAMYYRRVMR